MPTLRSLLETLRSLGAMNTALWGIARTASRATAGRVRIYRYYFVAQPAASPALPPAAAIRVRPVAASEPLVAQFPRPRAVIDGRYATGALCFAADRHGAFAGYIWLKEHRYTDDEARCEYLLVPAGEAVWDFDVYVDPAFRHGRTFVRLWSAAHAWMNEHGYGWSISRISAFNPDSLAAHRRLGMVRIGTATFLQMGGLQVAFLDRAPYLHVGWRDDQMPQLALTVPSTDGGCSETRTQATPQAHR